MERERKRKAVKTAIPLTLILISTMTFINIIPVNAWISKLNPDLDWSCNFSGGTWPSQFEEWNKVITAPVVVNLNDDNLDGFIDEQDVPDILCITYKGVREYRSNGILRAIKGCAERGCGGTDDLFAVTADAYQDPACRVMPVSQIAVADIDNDGEPEILVQGERDALGQFPLICFDNEGNLKSSWPTNPVSLPNLLGTSATWGIVIADLTGFTNRGGPDGFPEIIAGGRVYDNTGSLLWSFQAGRDFGGVRGLSMPCVADIDLRGPPEVVAGPCIYSNTGALIWDAPRVPDGIPAVANFDGDVWPEVVVVTDGAVYLLEPFSRTREWPFPVTLTGGRGGPPVIADFDSNRAGPEIGVAGLSSYDRIDADGNIYATTTIDDSTSGVTSSCAFDFEYDGCPEIVYSDETSWYILDGSSDTIHSAISLSSFTTFEMPVVADIDTDGRAEVVVPACDNPDNRPAGTDHGIFVYCNIWWPHARCIWNEHPYHITNINGDATVPQYETQNWLYYNNYRCQQTMGYCKLAAGSAGGEVYAFDYEGPLWDHTPGSPVVSVAMDNEGKYIVAGTRAAASGQLYIYEHLGPPHMLSTTLPPISTSYNGGTRGTESKSVDVKYSGASRDHIVAAATDEGLYLFTPALSQIWHYYDGSPETIVRISQDGNHIVCADYNTGLVHYFSHLSNNQPGWQSNDGTPVWSWQWPPIGHPWVFWVAISGDGHWVAVSGWYPDCVVLLDAREELASRRVVWAHLLAKGGYVRVDMPCSGESVVSANDDPTDTVGVDLLYFDKLGGTSGFSWDSDDDEPEWEFWPGPSQNVDDDFYSVAISGNGGVVAVGGTNPGDPDWDQQHVYFLDRGGSFLRKVPLYRGFDYRVQSIDLTFTGKRGVVGDFSGEIWFVSKDEDRALWHMAYTADPIHSVAISKIEPCMSDDLRPNIQVTDTQPHKTVVPQDSQIKANVTVTNTGDSNETTELSAYIMNGQEISGATILINLTRRETKTVTLSLNTTSLPKGNYTLFAQASIVPNEINVYDNTYTDGIIKIVMPGDINADGKVDMKDIYLVIKAFGSYPSHPRWNPNTDINNDNKIDMKDVYIIVKNFGKTDP